MRGEGEELNAMTEKNIAKVTKFRKDGETALENMVERMRKLSYSERSNANNREKRWGGRV